MTKDKYKITIFFKIKSWIIEKYKDFEKFEANYKKSIYGTCGIQLKIIRRKVTINIYI